MLSQQRSAILAAFKTGAILGPKIIAERAHLSLSSVNHMLPGMVAAGQLKRVALGQYTLPQSDQRGVAGNASSHAQEVPFNIEAGGDRAR